MQIFLGEANYLVGNMILSIVTNVMIVNHLSVVEFEFADLYEGEIVASSIKTLLDDGSDSLIFNCYHLHLLTRLGQFSYSMKGIIGPIANMFNVYL